MEESKEEREARENYEWAMGYERTVGYELENARAQRRLAFKRYRDLMAIKAGLEPASLTETARRPTLVYEGPPGSDEDVARSRAVLADRWLPKDTSGADPTLVEAAKADLRASLEAQTGPTGTVVMRVVK